jgi:hypothetical protein
MKHVECILEPIAKQCTCPQLGTTNSWYFQVVLSASVGRKA